MPPNSGSDPAEEPTPPGITFSVIIPSLNEEARLAEAIRSCWENGASEIIVSDGGSSDRTCEIAESERGILVSGKAGRGAQLQRGVQAATQPVLLFLHADNRLSLGCGDQIRNAFGPLGFQYCYFRQSIENRSLVYRWIERGNAWRARWQKLPYGDQGVSVTRALYDQTDGFQDIPLMEDVQFAFQLAKLARPIQLDGRLLVSDRRWAEQGPVRQTVSNWWTFTRYRWGTDPAILAEQYNQENNSRSGS